MFARVRAAIRDRADLAYTRHVHGEITMCTGGLHNLSVPSALPLSPPLAKKLRA